MARKYIFYGETCAICKGHKQCRPLIVVDNGEDHRSQYTRSVCASCLPVDRSEYECPRELPQAQYESIGGGA